MFLHLDFGSIYATLHGTQLSTQFYRAVYRPAVTMFYHLLLLIHTRLHELFWHNDILYNITSLHIATPETSLCICIFELIMHRQLSFLIWWWQSFPRAKRITAKCWVPCACTGITHLPRLPSSVPCKGQRSSHSCCQMTGEIYFQRHILSNHIVPMLYWYKNCSAEKLNYAYSYGHWFNVKHGHTYWKMARYKYEIEFYLRVHKEIHPKK